MTKRFHFAIAKINAEPLFHTGRTLLQTDQGKMPLPAQGSLLAAGQ
jgi:hypothetical protein